MKKYYETGESVICETCNLTDDTKEVQNFTDSYPDGVTCNDCGEVSTTDLPNRVNASITVTYDLNEVRKTLAELNEIQPHEVKDHEITDLVQTWLAEDLGSLSERAILQDENGENIDW